MRKYALVVLVLGMLAAGSADAQTTPAPTKPSICERAHIARVHVVHRYGHRAAGKNICRYGVIRHHRHRPADIKERWKYLLQLRGFLKRSYRHRPYLARVAVLPRRPPAGVMSRGYAPVGLARCIAWSESRFNPRANNGSHFGLAQWSYEAWGRMGGHRYAWRADYASYQHQLLVLSYGLVHWGCRDWCPYDPC